MLLTERELCEETDITITPREYGKPIKIWMSLRDRIRKT